MRRTARELLNEKGIVLERYAFGIHRAPCPECAEKKTRSVDNAVAVKIDECGFQLKCHRCRWQAHGFYAQSNLDSSVLRQIAAAETRRSRPDDPQKVAHIIETLRRTVSATDTLAEIYLRARAITIRPLPSSIRFEQGLWHTELKRNLPAMVCPLRDISTNTICGYHKTYLAPDGLRKIIDGTARKMFGRSKGAAIKLTANDQIEMALSVCEGIETGLSVLQAGYPVWALGSANSVKAFPVLAGIECLTIFADHDADGTGKKAALECGARWQRAGIEVEIVTPRKVGDDWNDVVAALVL